MMRFTTRAGSIGPASSLPRIPHRRLLAGLLTSALVLTPALPSWAETCLSVPVPEAAPGKEIACNDVFVYPTADAFPLLLDVLANDRQSAGRPLGQPELIDTPGADATVRADGSIVVSLLPGVEDTVLRYRLGDPQGQSSEATVTLSLGNKAPVGSALPIGTFRTSLGGGQELAIHLDEDLGPLWPEPDLCLVSFDPASALGGTVNLVDFIEPCELGGAVRFFYRAPNVEGIDSFTYVLKDASGVEGTGLVEIQVSGLAPPEPAFSAWCDPSPSLLCHFDGSSSEGGDGTLLLASALEWDFGDGSGAVSGTAVTDHAFAAAGVYDIRLTATDPATGISATESRLLVVGDAVPSVHANPVCGAGHACVFDAGIAGVPEGTDYVLSFDLRSIDGPAYPADAEGNCGGYWCRYQEGTATTLQTTLPGPGYYGLHVSLRPAEGHSWPGGTTSSDTIYFTVASDEPPVPSFTATPSPTDPLTVFLDGSSSTDDYGPLDFLWTIDGATAFGASVIHSVSAAGTYPVCLEVSDGVNPPQTSCQDVVIP